MVSQKDGKIVPLFKPGDLFTASVALDPHSFSMMEDVGICTKTWWGAGHWMYKIRWTKARFNPKYTEIEIEMNIASGDWSYYAGK